ncbi:MAG: MerR family transcriptional regulator [Desulfovibrio sp.]|uniref:MerR family transcriptional regulator n=1 Tax=Desulfovibrio sp. TaxID=885 RepID=UPI0039E28CEF
METKKLLKVGEFARLCHTTKETLLHYDRKGLLQPRYIAENGYRFYSAEQFFDFDMISLLKETGSSLDEIRENQDNCSTLEYINFIKKRVEMLYAEHRKIIHRMHMLTDLATIAEQALTVEFDRIFFEERDTESIRYYPVNSEKMLTREDSVECYSSCLMYDLDHGNTIYPPIGMIIPKEYAESREFKITHLFSKASGGNDMTVKEIKKGRYACLLHKGDMQSHKAALQRMVISIVDQKNTIDSDIYVYDQMNCVLMDKNGSYTAKYEMKII